MKAWLIAVALPFGLLVAGSSFAQVPAGAPAGTTGQCKDGSYTSADSKRGACRGHKGVQAWYAAADAAPAADKSDKTTDTKASKKAKKADDTAAASSGPAPAGSTGQCKDGSYTDTATKRGACRGHQGVKEWFAAAATAPAAAAPAAVPSKPAAAPAPAQPTAAAPARPATAPAPAAPAASAKTPASTTPAAGGGAGKVWVNTETKVYHCEGDRYYGTTKKGEYMSEADAIAKGSHASHGKACSK